MELRTITHGPRRAEMVTYWCPWCGGTAQGSGPYETIPCLRCAREFLARFGFWPRCGMVPLPARERPGVPGASVRRFVLTDPKTHRDRGATDVSPAA